MLRCFQRQFEIVKIKIVGGTKVVPQMSWVRKPLFTDVTDEFRFFTALVFEMLRPRPLVAKTGVTTLTDEKIAHFEVV